MDVCQDLFAHFFGGNMVKSGNTEGIVKSYNLIGYNAVGVNSKDLIAGLDYLYELSKYSNFPWLSANLVYKNTNKPVFTATTIVPVGTLNIGVTGITGQTQQELEINGEEALILPWHETLPKVVDQLAAQTDLVVLLSNLPTNTNQKIASSFKN